MYSVHMLRFRYTLCRISDKRVLVGVYLDLARSCRTCTVVLLDCYTDQPRTYNQTETRRYLFYAFRSKINPITLTAAHMHMDMSNELTLDRLGGSVVIMGGWLVVIGIIYFKIIYYISVECRNM
jgi:hypothetical protein